MFGGNDELPLTADWPGQISLDRRQGGCVANSGPLQADEGVNQLPEEPRVLENRPKAQSRVHMPRKQTAGWIRLFSFC
jgi:hypothetical protein